MKKVDGEKINAIGQTLEVNLSDIKRDWKKIFSRILYAIIQALVFLVTWISGESTRVTIRVGYSFSSRFVPALLFTSVIHYGNSIFLLPKDTQLLPRRARRITIFLGNLILSLTIFLLTASASPVYISGTLYGVYDNLK